MADIKPSRTIKVWTDGSYKEGKKKKRTPIGMGAIVSVEEGGKTEKERILSWRVLSKNTSSMHAELFAIQNVLESIPKSQRPTSHLIIYTDCMDAIRAIQDGKISDRYAGLVNHIIVLLGLFLSYELVWCKAHAGCPWNGKANRAARKARRGE